MPPVARVLAGDPGALVRGHAAWALGEIAAAIGAEGAGCAVGDIAAALARAARDDADPGVREEARLAHARARA